MNAEPFGSLIPLQKLFVRQSMFVVALVGADTFLGQAGLSGCRLAWKGVADDAKSYFKIV